MNENEAIPAALRFVDVPPANLRRRGRHLGGLDAFEPPIVTTVVRQIMLAIAVGRLPADTVLPPYKDLATVWNVDRNHVAAIVGRLRGLGAVVGDRRRIYAVVTDIRPVCEAVARWRLSRAIRFAIGLGCSRAQVARLTDEVFDVLISGDAET